MDRDILFTHVQSLFRPGMVTLVGSGASAAMGLPTMSQLADYVVAHIEGSEVIANLDIDDLAEWTRIASALRAGQGLEAAIRADQMPAELGGAISHHVANAVYEAESHAIDQMMSSGKRGVFATLVRHLLRVDSNPSVITTNYDRLIEVDLALDGIVVDTMFFGSTVAHLDEVSARQEHERLERAPGRNAQSRRGYREHVRIAKPHGSLDWMEVDGVVVKTDLVSSIPRRVIAPGGSKYRLGYESPFDEHRARANAAIERASAFLIVGYGFNDDHLETRLRPRFPGSPALIVAQKLTPRTRDVLATNPAAIGIEAGSSSGTCRVINADGECEIDGSYWQLEQLLEEAI